MGTVPQAYFNFIMDYAPYFYYIPGTGVDTEWGRGPAPAAHAIDFLYEAYFNEQFYGEKTNIYNKIVALADYLLSIQSTDDVKLAYGGFQSTDDSSYYYSIDAMRVIPALLKAYDLTDTSAYLDAAKLAGGTFLRNMQHKPSELGQHDKYYGGFAQAVTITDDWLPEMHIIDLYGLIALKMLYDRTSEAKYQAMIGDAANFYRNGFEELYSRYSPPPSGDGQWHRTGTSNTVYDDDFGYALCGLLHCEGWSSTVRKVYEFINTIGPSADYPAYNSAVCWSGYVDVVARKVDCEYYDTVTAGILWQIRTGHDKSALELSFNIAGSHQEDFMYWGVKFQDYSPVENKKATVTVSWLSFLFLNYSPPMTPFTRILRSHGEDVSLYPVRQAEGSVSYGEGVTIRALVGHTTPEELVMEPGYVVNDYVTIHVFTPIRHRDKIRRKGVDYEVGPVEEYDFQGQLMYRRAVCRRLLG